MVGYHWKSISKRSRQHVYSLLTRSRSFSFSLMFSLCLYICQTVLRSYIYILCNICVRPVRVSGVSRSIALATALLMLHNQTTYEDTISYIKSRRPISQPNGGFVRQLRIWEALLGLSVASRSNSTHSVSSSANAHMSMNQPILNRDSSFTGALSSLSLSLFL